MPLLTTAFLFAQSEKIPLAEIGNQVISVEEFLHRYELTPQLFREQKRTAPVLKQEFLYTLIAEKLLAEFGEANLLDTIEIVKQTLNNFKELFIKDALYDIVVAEKAKYNADSLLGFYLSNSTAVKCNYIKTKSYDEAERIYSLLEKGVPFDFFASDSALSSGDTLAVTFGQFNDAIENEILTLPVNGFTRPILLEDDWYILSVASKYYPIIEKLPGWESEYKRLRKLAKDRAESSFYKNYMTNLFKNLNIRANGKLLKALADETFNVLEIKKQSLGEQKKYYLESSDLALISRKINHELLNQTYFKLPNDSVLLKDFINFLRFENLAFDKIDLQIVLDILNGKTRKFIEHKVLVNEGYKLGLENSQSVKEKYNMWKQNYFYQLVLSEFADSAEVSDEEIKLYYNQLHRGKLKSKEVKVVEVVTANLDDAEKVLNELEDNIDIQELVIKYSIRPQEKFSEAEFKPISAYVEISSILDRMKPGEIYGPVKVADGYSIFKLIDVREDSTFDSKAFVEIKKEYGNELRHLKMKDRINKFIAKLAVDNKITVNEDLLKTVRTTTHNAVVFQLLGFGGKITAVPLIAPNSEWVEHWLNSLKVIP